MTLNTYVKCVFRLLGFFYVKILGTIPGKIKVKKYLCNNVMY